MLASFQGFGLFLFSVSTGWTPVLPFEADTLLAADVDGNGQDDILATFLGAPGLWIDLNLQTWRFAHPLVPVRAAAGHLDGNAQADVVFDFGEGDGIWVWRNGTTWEHLHPFSSEGLVLFDRDGNGRDEIAIDFGDGIGLWIYDRGTWALLHPLSPKTLATGRFH